MRLIDADRLYDYISDVFTDFGHDVMSVKDALETIKTAPTINAVGLPCKVGDTVYILEHIGIQTMPEITERIVTQVRYQQSKNSGEKWKFFYTNKRYCVQDTFGIGAFGVSVFLTREEAEKALEWSWSGTP